MQTADGGGWTSNTDGNTEITAVDFNHDLCCLVSVYCCNHDEEQVAILTQTTPWVWPWPRCYRPSGHKTDWNDTDGEYRSVESVIRAEKSCNVKFQQHGAQLLDV